jgi:uncharacterized protein
MRVPVEKIRDTVLELSEVIPASLWDMDSHNIRFVNKIAINCKILRIDKEILVDAEINLQRDIVCSRCLAQVHQVVRHNFKKDYDSASLGDYLELDNDIREEILLDFPMKVLCNIDCKGICASCGANLNLENCKCQKLSQETRHGNIKF